jgi:hypothetical protein
VHCADVQTIQIGVVTSSTSIMTLAMACDDEDKALGLGRLSIGLRSRKLTRVELPVDLLVATSCGKGWMITCLNRINWRIRIHSTGGRLTKPALQMLPQLPEHI